MFSHALLSSRLNLKIITISIACTPPPSAGIWTKTGKQASQTQPNAHTHSVGWQIKLKSSFPSPNFRFADHFQCQLNWLSALSAAQSKENPRCDFLSVRSGCGGSQLLPFFFLLDSIAPCFTWPFCVTRARVYFSSFSFHSFVSLLRNFPRRLHSPSTFSSMSAHRSQQHDKSIHNKIHFQFVYGARSLPHIDCKVQLSRMGYGIERMNEMDTRTRFTFRAIRTNFYAN